MQKPVRVRFLLQEILREFMVRLGDKNRDGMITFEEFQVRYVLWLAGCVWSASWLFGWLVGCSVGWLVG